MHPIARRRTHSLVGMHPITLRASHVHTVTLRPAHALLMHPVSLRSPAVHAVSLRSPEAVVRLGVPVALLDVRRVRLVALVLLRLVQRGLMWWPLVLRPLVWWPLVLGHLVLRSLQLALVAMDTVALRAAEAALTGVRPVGDVVSLVHAVALGAPVSLRMRLRVPLGEALLGRGDAGPRRAVQDLSLGAPPRHGGLRCWWDAVQRVAVVVVAAGTRQAQLPGAPLRSVGHRGARR